VGVYCLVHMCIAAEQPLPVDTRVAIVELAIAHELIAERCDIRTPMVLPARGIVERIKRLFAPPKPYMGVVHSGDLGPWIGERIRGLDGTSDYIVSCSAPWWNGEQLTGPFEYAVTREQVTVKTVNLYREPDQRSPFEPADGVIGQFRDVLSVDAKRGFDARIAAKSTFVRELKKLTGAKVICRSSWV